MKAAVLIFLILPLSGCALFHKLPFIKSGNTTVTGPANPGKPATLATSEAGSVLPLPAGTTFTSTKIEAVPATLGPQGHPYQPARTVTEIRLTEPTELRTTEAHVNADTGTVDTTTVTHQQDLAASQPLLWAALACGAAGIFFIYIHYPTPAALCGGGAIICLVAWKVAQAPPWLWVGAAVCLAGAGALYLGHERGLNSPPTPTPPTK